MVTKSAGNLCSCVLKTIIFTFSISTGNFWGKTITDLKNETNLFVLLTNLPTWIGEGQDWAVAVRMGEQGRKKGGVI